MSTILFFTSDRLAFANLSPTATTEKIILTPDPVDGNRLFIGNSTMIGYDGRCNISTFDGSKATLTFDTANKRVGIGISSPTVALDVVDAGGVRIVGPTNITGDTNITGATLFTGNSRVTGTATAGAFYGSAMGLTSIPAARIVGALPAGVYADATIPTSALSGYNNGSLVLSGVLATDTITVSSITSAKGIFSSISSGNADFDILNVRALFAGSISSGSIGSLLINTGVFSSISTGNLGVGVLNTLGGSASTFTVGTLFAGSISSGSIGSLLIATGAFSSISTGIIGAGLINTGLISAAIGNASSFTIGTLFAGTISSGSLTALSSAIVSISNLGVTNTANIISVSTNLNTVSNTVNFLLAVSNISAITISTSYGFFSTISAGRVYGRFIGDGSGLTGVAAGSGIAILPPILSTTLLSTGILTASNISVASISTNYGFFSTISAGTVFGRFIGDGSGLTSISNTGAVLAVSNNVTTVSNLLNAVSTNVTSVSTNVNTVSNLLNTVSTNVTTVSTNVNTVSNLLNAVSTNVTTVSTNINTVSNTINFLLAVSNISAITLSTSYGFLSTISAGTVFGRFIGDGSGLTGIPTAAGLLTVSNLLNAVSTNVTTVSTNFTTVSNLLNAVSTNVNTVSNLLNTVSTNVTTVSTNVNTVSNTVNFLLAVSNISAITLSTSYGFFSTISAGTVFGRFIGDGSQLTNIPASASILTVSNLLNSVSTNVTTVSTNVNTVSNLLNAVSTNVTTVSTNLNTVSNLVNSVSTNVTTVSTTVNTVSNRVNTVSNTVNFLLAVSNISAITLSTSYGFFSTISAGTVFGRFIGDGSGLSGITGGISVFPPILSTTLLSTGLLTASNVSVAVISTNTGSASTFYINKLTTSTVSALLGSFSTLSVSQVYISSLTVDNLIIGNDNGYINMGDIIAGSLSTFLVTTTNIVAGNISVAAISTNYGFFSTISAGTIYARFVGDGSGLTGIPTAAGLLTVSNLLNAVSTNVTTVSTNLNTVSNLLNSVSTNVTTVSTNLNTVSNRVNYLLTVSNISAVTISTSYGFFSTISAGTVFGKFVGDGSGLTGIPTAAGLLTVSNLLNSVSTNVTTVSTNLNTVSNTVNFLLAVSNISAITLSTTYGFFSTISAGTVFGRFIGDGSGLTGIPTAAGLLTVSNLLNSVSTNVTTVSTNLNTVSNLLNAVSTNVTTVSTNLNTISNLLNGVSTNATTVSTNLNTVSNTVNFLLTVSNISAVTMSTSYGFFSTISAGTIFGKFVGDGTNLTGIPTTAGLLAVSNLVNAVSTNVTTVSTNLNTVSNLLNAVSTNVTTVSTNLNTVSNLVNSVSTNVTTVSTNLNTVSNTVNFLLAVSNISAITLSTSYGFFSTISAGIVYGKFVGDGSALTGVSGSGGSGISNLPPVLSTTLLSTGLLTASNISTATISTNYGFFSTLSSGTIYARFIGDGSFLTNVPSSLPENITVNSISTNSISTAIAWIGQATISSISVNTINSGTAFISSLRTSEVHASTVTAAVLSSYIVYASSINTPNIYVTNIYANDGGIANVVASSLNASRAIFVQVIASSFQGALIGTNLMTVQTL